jgi:FAD/FMN-containing dehydrogenase
MNQQQKIKTLQAQIDQMGLSDIATTDEELLKIYAVDWSGVLQPKASLLVRPRSTLEVSKILKACSELKIPVVPSGGRTGLSGGACAAEGEVVLSLEKMNTIGKPDPLSLTLAVGAGAITARVHEVCREEGLLWPVDFASKESSQVGGNIATNAGGIHVIRYGSTRSWVLGLTVVKMDGTILQLNRALEKNNTGLDLRHLMIGSEGVLAVITEAVLKLTPLSDDSQKVVALLKLKNFSDVIRFFEKLRACQSLGLSAYEAFSGPCYEVVKGIRDSETASHCYVVCEIFSDPQEQFLNLCQEALESGLLLDVQLAQSEKDAREIWKIRESIAEMILHGHEVHQQDISVPLVQLESFTLSIQKKYQESYPDYEVFIFGHIGDGNLHVFIRKPTQPVEMKSEDFHLFCEQSDRELFKFVKEHQGSVSAEHGVGVLKKPALPYSRTQDELDFVRALKMIWDPQGLLNPGKMITPPPKQIDPSSGSS